MNPETAESLIRITAALAVAFYAARLVTDAGTGPARQHQRLARCFWTAGCLLLLLHVVLAFAAVHGWSHAQAYDHTARRTAETVNLDWGGGIYFNYAVALVWSADVAAWWLHGLSYPQQRRALYWFVQIFLAFMVLNATVVFGPSYWKWIAAIVACGGALAVWLRRP